MLKKITAASLFVFWAVVVSILVAGLLFYQKNNIVLNNTGQNPGQNQVAGLGSQVAGTAGSIVLNSAEAAKHNSQQDCWVIVYNKIYNLTGFSSFHSGGAGAIAPYCGKDGTAAFETKDGQGSHRQGDISILANYYVGDLNQTASQQAIQQNFQNTNSAAPPTGGRREFEDD